MKFYGVFQEHVQLAGGMLFIFQQTNVIHAQKLSADYTFNEFSLITYLYYKVIEMLKSKSMQNFHGESLQKVMDK